MRLTSSAVAWSRRNHHLILLTDVDAAIVAFARRAVGERPSGNDPRQISLHFAETRLMDQGTIRRASSSASVASTDDGAGYPEYARPV